jgi:hypothetical protein
MKRTKKPLHLLIAVAALSPIGIGHVRAQGTPDTGSAAFLRQRISTAESIERMLADGSKWIPAGDDKSLLVVYYPDERTQRGLVQQLPRYKDALAELEGIYNILCLASADQKDLRCVRMTAQGADPHWSAKDMTLAESGALLAGFEKACECKIDQSSTATPPTPAFHEEKAVSRAQVEDSINYADFYSQAMTGGLKVGKRYLFRSIINVTGRYLFLHNPNYPNGPQMQLQAIAAFDSQTNYREFLASDDVGPRKSRCIVGTRRDAADS